jgi:hypothetical protein
VIFLYRSYYEVIPYIDIILLFGFIQFRAIRREKKVSQRAAWMVDCLYWRLIAGYMYIASGSYFI